MSILTKVLKKVPTVLNSKNPETCIICLPSTYK